MILNKYQKIHCWSKNLVKSQKRSQTGCKQKKVIRILHKKPKPKEQFTQTEQECEEEKKSVSYLLNRRQAQTLVFRIHLHHMCLQETQRGKIVSTHSVGEKLRYTVELFVLNLTMLRKSVVSPSPLTLSVSLRLSTALSLSPSVCTDITGQKQTVILALTVFLKLAF